MNTNTDTVAKKEKQRLRKNQLARERYAKKKIRYSILENYTLTTVKTAPSLEEYEVESYLIIDGITEITYKKMGTDEGGNYQEEESDDDNEEEEEEEDETPWCYANNKNAICNCSQPCSRP